MFNEEKDILIQQIICCDDGGILFSNYDQIFNNEKFRILCEENDYIKNIYKNLRMDNNSLYENNINILNLKTCNIYENRIPNQLLLSIHPKLIEIVNRLNDNPNNAYGTNFHIRNIQKNEIILITDPERWGNIEKYVYHIIKLDNLQLKKVKYDYELI